MPFRHHGQRHVGAAADRPDEQEDAALGIVGVDQPDSRRLATLEGVAAEEPQAMRREIGPPDRVGGQLLVQFQRSVPGLAGGELRARR